MKLWVHNVPQSVKMIFPLLAINYIVNNTHNTHNYTISRGKQFPRSMKLWVHKIPQSVKMIFPLQAINYTINNTHNTRNYIISKGKQIPRFTKVWAPLDGRRYAKPGRCLCSKKYIKLILAQRRSLLSIGSVPEIVSFHRASFSVIIRIRWNGLQMVQFAVHVQV